MDMVELQEWRRARLNDAIAHYKATGKGGATGLGRALGFSSGAFIMQMARGERAVTEKTTAAIEALPGMNKWFVLDTDTIGALTNMQLQPVRVVRVSALAHATSAGDNLHPDMIQGELTVSQEWVERRIGETDHTRLRFIHAQGDSMEPTFSAGDLLLVDTKTQQVNVDGVYVFDAHGRLFIRRVRQRMDGSYEISCDNPTHKGVDTLANDNDVSVMGRVVWVWNGRKL